MKKDDKIKAFIEESIKHIRNKTIGAIINNKSITKLYNENDKGKIGKAVEEFIFGIKNNSLKEPDFKELGIELKVTGFKKSENKGLMVAKERLSLSMISYNNIVNENFLESELIKKNRNLLIIFYEYVAKQKIENVKILNCALIDFLQLENIEQIKKDFEIIKQKVVDGKAHEISGSDTIYLEACTKGSNSTDTTSQPFSDIPAKRRGFALKNKLVTKLFYSVYDDDYVIYKVEQIVETFKKFFSKSLNELCEMFGISSVSKSMRWLIVLKILNVKSLKEIKPIVMDEYLIKTIELTHDDRLVESVPICRITNEDFEINIPFDESNFYESLNKKIIFIVFKETKNKGVILDNLVIFTFDENMIENAKFVYEDTMYKFRYSKIKENINGKNIYNVVKKSDNKYFHVRPKARDSNDTYITPMGEKITKLAFWINNDVVLGVVKNNTKT